MSPDEKARLEEDILRERACEWCRWYIPYRECEAFKDRIPDEIWSGELDHREPFQGDNGFRFEAGEPLSLGPFWNP